MRAIGFDEFGPATVLRVREVPTPRPGPGEVRIRVEAAGVCYHDILHRSGRLPKARTDWILGHEVAGTVDEVGPDVDELGAGTRVVALNRLSCGACRHCREGRPDLCTRSRLLGSSAPGGYAEYLVVPQGAAVPIPYWLDAGSAALAVCPVGTSVRALIGVAGVDPGDTVLVVGSGGGLGVHQIQVARGMGARVIALTTSRSKVELLESLGAEVVPYPQGSRFRAPIREAAEEGVDIVMENVVTSTLAEALWTLRPGGIAVVLGNVGVEDVRLNPGLIIARRLSVVGSGSPTSTDVRRSLAMIGAGTVRPIVGATFGFHQVAEAHELVEARAVPGRVILSGW